LKYSGVQSGPRLGKDLDKTPTNKKIEMVCAVFVNFNNEGLIQEQREYYDTAAFLKQLQ